MLLKAKIHNQGGWRIHSTARVGQRQDHDHGGELKDSPGKYLFPHYESNSFSQQLQMEGLPHSNQKTCIKISLTPDLTEIKLWTEGGLGEALGVLKTTFSFSDSREGSPNSAKLLYSQFLLQQKNTDEKQ